LYSLGELDPRLGGSHPVIVTFLRNDVLLDDPEGMARIINPGDKAGARRVFNITRIRVLTPPLEQETPHQSLDLGQEAHGRPLTLLPRPQKIDDLASLIHHTIQIAPLPAYTHVSFIDTPTHLYRWLAAVKRFLELRTILEDPTVDGRMVSCNTACPHHLLVLADRAGSYSKEPTSKNLRHNLAAREKTDRPLP
jgi:hypothetical protein